MMAVRILRNCRAVGAILSAVLLLGGCVAVQSGKSQDSPQPQPSQQVTDKQQIDRQIQQAKERGDCAYLVDQLVARETTMGRDMVGPSYLPAMTALVGLGEECVPVLLERMSDRSRDGTTRGLVTDCLSRIEPRSAETISFLASNLKFEQPFVCRDAAHVLGGIGPPAKEAVPQLMEVVKKVSPAFASIELRDEVVASLGGRRDFWSYIDGLKFTGFNEGDEGALATALIADLEMTLFSALRRITGQDFGPITEPQAKEWLSWWQENRDKWPQAVTAPAAEPETQPEMVAAEPTKPEDTEQQQGPAVELALRFTPDQQTTYRVTTESGRSVRWEGPSSRKPTAFTGGHTGNRIEMTFDQRVRSVDEKGNGLVEITIKALKYLGTVKDNVVLDFDSSREKDQQSPLAKLAGQSYVIEMSRAGQVSRVVDVNGPRAALRGSSSAHRTGLKLISDQAIRKRHTIQALVAAGNKQLRVGDSWSDVDTFSFDLMGSRSYERMYTLKEVTGSGGQQTAVVEMNAIPSTAKAEELHKEQAEGFFAKMFDNTETYKGRLRLDSNSGEIEEYVEELRTEWVAAEPSPGQGDERPAVLRMTATSLYRFESVDQ